VEVPDDSSRQALCPRSFRWVGGQAGSLALELRTERAILFEQVVDVLLSAMVQPAREGHNQELQRGIVFMRSDGIGLDRRPAITSGRQVHDSSGFLDTTG